MEKKHLKGQVLSEKEMRKVKGGTPYKVGAEVIENGKWKFCPACAYEFTDEELEALKNGDTVKCQDCGSIVTQ